MRRIFLFMNVSLDGYFEAPGGDLSWAGHDYEAFSPESSAAVDTILLGRRTFEMMRSYWPTPPAAEMAPEVARFMNDRSKVVASHAPFDPGWQNATVITGDVPEAVRQLKAQPGKEIIVMGSNILCVSLLTHGLLDELQILVNPVVLGAGTPLFRGLQEPIPLALKSSRQFQSGGVLLTYEPAGR